MCRRLGEGAGWRRFEEKHGEAITPFSPNYRGLRWLLPLPTH